MNRPQHESPERASNPDQPGSPPTEESHPVGDALPTPIEPGLDQPLPEKGESDIEPHAIPGKSGNIPRDGIADQVDASDPDLKDRDGLPRRSGSDFA